MAIFGGLFFDEKGEKTIYEVQNALASAGVEPVSSISDVPPHITIHISSSGDLRRWESGITRAVENHPLLEINVSHVGWFPSASVLFLAPVVPDQLKSIYRMTVQSLAESSGSPEMVRDRVNWVPHITLALSMADGLIEKALKIAGRKIPINLAADRLSIGSLVDQTAGSTFRRPGARPAIAAWGVGDTCRSRAAG